MFEKINITKCGICGKECMDDVFKCIYCTTNYICEFCAKYNGKKEKSSELAYCPKCQNHLLIIKNVSIDDYFQKYV